MIRNLALAAFILAAANAMADAPAAPPARPDTQAIVGPTGTMFNGNNTALRLADDGSMADVAATAPGSVVRGALPSQDSDRSALSRIGGGN